jgi:MFS-type transporter involved in bile tolerance (Atg22 family)
MCWKVKEGEYPPPPENVGGRKGIKAAAKTYVTECLEHRIYLFFFLYNVFAGTLAGAIGVFAVFLNLSLGLTLQQIGTIAAVMGVAGMLLTYPAGMLADRYHPLRVIVPIQIAAWLLVPLNLIWLFTSFSPQVNFRIVFGLSALSFPASLIINAVNMPMYMRVLPKERYGQFCSFNALIGAFASIPGGMAAGVFMDLMRRFFPDARYGKDFCYRFIPVWQIAFFILALVFLLLFYREWKRLGGDHFRPPVSTRHARTAEGPEPVESPRDVIAEEKAAN